MNNQEAIEAIKLAQAQIEWDYPMDYTVAFDMAISALQAQDLQSTCNQFATDTIIRQAAPDALEKCYTCKHVYQSVNGADTLFYRCRRGCKYEEFKPKRSIGNSEQS